eukprot:364571-Chlamydomonas_euryale.AAC.4
MPHIKCGMVQNLRSLVSWACWATSVLHGDFTPGVCVGQRDVFCFQLSSLNLLLQSASPAAFCVHQRTTTTTTATTTTTTKHHHHHQTPPPPPNTTTTATTTATTTTTTTEINVQLCGSRYKCESSTRAAVSSELPQHLCKPAPGAEGLGSCYGQSGLSI